MTDQQHDADTGGTHRPAGLPPRIGRLRRLTRWMRPAAPVIPDSPAGIEDLPPPPTAGREPAHLSRLSPDALAREILTHVLGGTHEARRPTREQEEALVATINAALGCGWRPRALIGSLSRWDTDQTRGGYVLLRGKLAVLAPKAGYHCPRCRLSTPPEAGDGFCRHCRSHTGDG